MSGIQFREVKQQDTREWYRLRSRMWPDLSDQRHTIEMEGYYEANDPSYKVFVAVQDGDRLAGLVEVSCSQAEEKNGAYLCGYLHGIIVDEEFPCDDLAGRLLAIAEEWFMIKKVQLISAEFDADETDYFQAIGAWGFSIHKKKVEFRKVLDPSVDNS